MIDHVSIGVRDLVRAKRFYDAALKPQGLRCLCEGDDSLGYGRGSIGLWIGMTEKPVQPDEKSGLHICFSAPDANSVARSTRRALLRAAATMELLACAWTTRPTTLRRMSSTRTAIALRRIADRRGGDSARSGRQPP